MKETRHCLVDVKCSCDVYITAVVAGGGYGDSGSRYQPYGRY